MKTKMTKSWKLTLATIIIAIVMIILPTFGVVGVTEHQVESIIYLALGISAIGAGNKVGKKLVNSRKLVTEETKGSGEVEIAPEHPKNKRTIVPKLGPVGSKFQTNFIKSDVGNTLPYGHNLWVRIEGVRSYITAILKDSAGNIIQIDQSHELDEDKNIETTRLEMLGRDGLGLPRGVYSVEYKGDSGSSDSIGVSNDSFTII